MAFLERRGKWERTGSLVVVGIPLGLVGAIVLVSGWGPVGTGSGGVQSSQMGGLGVLDFRGLNRHSVVDHRDVLGSVPGTVRLGLLVVSVVFLGSWGVVLLSLDLGVGGGVFGLGVLHFLGLKRNSLVDHRDVDGSVPGLLGWGMVPVLVVGGDRGSNWTMSGLDGGVSGKVGSLGGGHFRGVSRNVSPWGGTLVQAGLGFGMGGKVGSLGSLDFRGL